MNANTQGLTGNCCVVAKTNGQSNFVRLEDGENVFEKAKKLIGCRFIDHVQVERLAPGVILEYLVNDEGYPQWGNDPTKINPIGTFIYNGGQMPDHYILGDIVFCLCIDGIEGGEFVGMSERVAALIALSNNNDLIHKARAVCGNPSEIPYPKTTISSYATTDDLIKAMKGDKTVKPIDEKVIGGDSKDAEA